MSACTTCCCGPLLLLLFLLGSTAAAAATMGDLAAKNARSAEAGISSSESSSSRDMAFVILAHQRQHADQQQRHQKPTAPLARRSLIVNAATQWQSAMPAIPVYGNWCGPNYGSGTPIDEIDDCCRGHDLCYDRTKVYNHCTCDSDLVSCLNKADVSKLEVKKRAVRSSIVKYFENTVCRCSKDEKMCMPAKTCSCPAVVKG